MSALMTRTIHIPTKPDNRMVGVFGSVSEAGLWHGCRPSGEGSRGHPGQDRFERCALLATGFAPLPTTHLVRYHGILGPAAKDRAKVVPTPPASPTPDAARTDSAGTDKAGAGESREIDVTKLTRVSRLPWALLLKRVFMTDALTCPKCHGRMKILAALTKPEAIRKILDHLGIPSEAPHRTAARPPPQAELSGTSDLAEVDYADLSGPEW